jgi:hypothetical protein
MQNENRQTENVATKAVAVTMDGLQKKNLPAHQL